jgi:hypothetical protein
MSGVDYSERLGDKLWRLGHLYSIRCADTGRVVPYVPRPEQMAIYEALIAGARKIIILKARRLGMSTAIDVYAADEAIFSEGKQISIVDRKQDDASKKLNGICKTAFASLPEPLREKAKVLRDNDSAWEIVSRSGGATSAIYAGMNARGGTNQLLHISEWGVIQADDARRSEEILTGALPSAEHGVTIVETTWKGGRGGHLWDIVKEALERPEAERTRSDWQVFFFPWWRDPTYSEEGNVKTIPPEIGQYLDAKEAETGHRFTDGQRCWYTRRRRTLGLFTFREFPTTIDECFQSPMEGAIYADLLDRLRGEAALRPGAVDGSALVHTFWDLGSPVNTVTWYVQFIGGEIRVIDCDLDLDLTPVERAARMLAKGYNYGWHYLPHDARATERSGRTFQGELANAGIRNTRVLPRTHDVWIGINRLRQLMPRMTFRLPQCDPGLEALANYHTRRESGTGIAHDEPVHDWSSHAADALRVLAEAEMHGLLEGGSDTVRQARQRHTPIVHMGLGAGRKVVR